MNIAGGGIGASPNPVKYWGGARSAPIWWIAAVLTLVIVGVAHAWCSAPFPNDVDPMNFVAALRRFDVLDDAPHAPGYPLFVGAARVARVLTGEMHAYQGVNLLCVLLMGAMGFAALASLGRPALGLAWCVACTTHPLVWAATIVPECYVTDAAAGTCLVAIAVLLRRRSDLVAALGVAVVVLVQGLLRPVSAVMLQPLAVGACALLAVAPSLRRALLGFVASGLVVAVAYALVVACAGGAEAYGEAARTVMLASFRASSILAGAPLQAHAAMVAKYLVWLALLGGVPVLLALLARWAPRRGGDSRTPGEAADPTLGWRWSVVGLLWFVPPAAVYLLFYYLKPTYHLVYLPLLIGVGVVATWRLVGRRPGALVAIGMGVGAVQLAFVLVGGRVGLPEQIHRLTLAGLHTPAGEVGEFLRCAEALPEHAVSLILPGRPLPGNVRAVRLVRRAVDVLELDRGDASSDQGYRAISRCNPERWVPEVLSPAMDSVPPGCDEVLIVGRREGALTLVRSVVPADRTLTAVVHAAGW